jgi:hypothetical protein
LERLPVLRRLLAGTTVEDELEPGDGGDAIESVVQDGVRPDRRIVGPHHVVDRPARVVGDRRRGVGLVGVESVCTATGRSSQGLTERRVGFLAARCWVRER